MKQILAFILVSLVFSPFMTGCTEPPGPVAEQYPQRSQLKITDLGPADQIPLEVQCVFTVIVYHLPLKNIQSIPSELLMLSSKGLTFDDRDGFSANHLWAGFGIPSLGPDLVTAFGKLEAGRTGIKKFILFQDYPEEIAGVPVEMGQSVFYIRGDGTVAGRRVPGGRLSLVLRAQPDTPRKGFSHVEIEPLFRPTTIPNMPVQSRESLFQSVSFPEGGVQSNMAEGDFIILAATKIQPDSSMFGRFFLEPDSKEPEAVLYLILCQQAGAM